MDYKLKFLNKEELQKVRENLRGILPADKVLIISPKAYKSGSGIIIKQDTDALPRKGQIIQLPNQITEIFEGFKDILEVGQITTYGMYAGKELVMDYLNGLHLKEYLETNPSQEEKNNVAFLID